MQLNQPGRDLIRKWEGFKSCPYLDTGGVATIGIGTTFYPNGNLVKMSDPCIDINKAYMYLDYVVNKQILKYLPSIVKSQLNSNQTDAVICLVYNIGLGNFKKSHVLAEINKDPNSKLIPELWSRWNTDNGVKLAGLVARRNDEIKLYFS